MRGSLYDLSPVDVATCTADEFNLVFESTSFGESAKDGAEFVKAGTIGCSIVLVTGAKSTSSASTRSRILVDMVVRSARKVELLCWRSAVNGEC